MFCLSRSTWTDFGNGTTPCWRIHRKLTWAVDFPCAAAIFSIVGSTKTLAPCPPNGPQASTTMSMAWSFLISSAWVQPGWTSIWSTIGLILAVFNSSATWCGIKLLSPIARILPASYNSSIARQVSALILAASAPNCFSLAGQWIRYKSK